jgi:hypothetical protein
VPPVAWAESNSRPNKLAQQPVSRDPLTVARCWSRLSLCMAAVRSRASANTRQRRVCAVHTCSRSSARSGVHVRSRREMWLVGAAAEDRILQCAAPRVKYKAKTNGSPRHNITHKPPPAPQTWKRTLERGRRERRTPSRSLPTGRPAGPDPTPPTPHRTAARGASRTAVPGPRARGAPRDRLSLIGYDIILFI